MVARKYKRNKQHGRITAKHPATHSDKRLLANSAWRLSFCWNVSSDSAVSVLVRVQESTEWKTSGYSASVTQHAVGVKGLVSVKHYQVVTFVFTIERSSTFFQWLLIAPSILIVTMTLCLFCIPVHSAERFVLGLRAAYLSIYFITYIFISVYLMYLSTSLQ